ncbi:MAG: nitroreductase family protein [Fidelibacterota bacterium]|jgi:nitroreductase
MTVYEAIQRRRSYRHLENVEITDEIIDKLSRAVQLSPSCFNNQPWRYVFVRDPEKLKALHEVYSKGNEWTHDGSLVIAVTTRKEDDCVVGSREYYQFDTGLSVGQLLLQATELGLTAHPIAGFSPKKTRKVLHIPEDYEVITLIIVGKKAVGSPDEPAMPRKEVKEIIFQDTFL